MALNLRRRRAATPGDDTAAGQPTMTQRAGVGASRGLNLLAAAVDLVVAVVAVIIIAGILFVVLDANMSNSIVHHVHDWAKWLVGPFDKLFTPKNHKLEIAINWGIALAVYVLVGRFIASLLRRTGPATPRSRCRPRPSPSRRGCPSPGRCPPCSQEKACEKSATTPLYHPRGRPASAKVVWATASRGTAEV